ncbi:MAG: archease [Dehalococcoidia bacterium]
MNIAQRPPYELLEHTADAGIVAHGATLAEAFCHAAEGMYSLMVEPESVKERESRQVVVSAEDSEGLLTAWLLELLFLTETEEMVFRRFAIDELGPRELRGRAFGEPLDLSRHRTGVGVKAVTRHLLEVAQEDGGYRVRVLFDI